jgi:hypothetical protein
MKKTLVALCFLISISLLTAGCGSTKYNLASLAGVNIRDLEAVRSEGVTRTLNLSYEDTYNKILEIAKKQKLTVYQSNLNKGYIILIGFPKQETTTRIGVFFDSISDDRTEITLSSLSSTCLITAEPIILGDETISTFIII